MKTMKMTKRTATVERLERSRQEAEKRLADVRRALAREIRWNPKSLWLAPLVAFGCGVVLAQGLARRRKP